MCAIRHKVPVIISPLASLKNVSLLINVNPSVWHIDTIPAFSASVHSVTFSVSLTRGKTDAAFMSAEKRFASATISLNWWRSSSIGSGSVVAVQSLPPTTTVTFLKFDPILFIWLWRSFMWPPDNETTLVWALLHQYLGLSSCRSRESYLVHSLTFDKISVTQFQLLTFWSHVVTSSWAKSEVVGVDSTPLADPCLKFTFELSANRIKNRLRITLIKLFYPSRMSFMLGSRTPLIRESEEGIYGK